MAKSKKIILSRSQSVFELSQKIIFNIKFFKFKNLMWNILFSVIIQHLKNKMFI